VFQRITNRFLSIAKNHHIESIIKKAQRYGFLPSSFDNAQSFVGTMESNLFNCLLNTLQHVLYQLLPSVKDTMATFTSPYIAFSNVL